jgi:hypothetical protein
MMRSSYLALAVLGAVAPWVAIGPELLDTGIGMSFLQAALVNGVTTGFTLDLLVSSVVFWVWIAVDAPRSGVRARWPFVAINLLIGLSCALPAYLWFREGALSAAARP